MTERKIEKSDSIQEEGSPEDLSRRGFLKFLMGISFVLSLIPFTPMVEFFFAKSQENNPSRKKIANKKDLPEGSTIIFFFPGEEDKDRSFLTHLSQEYQQEAKEEGTDQFITDGFVAFNTVCPHLECPIELPDDDVFICPCHGGFFSIIDGTVLGGPVPRPLPAIKLEIDEGTGDIYAVELIGEIGYGREQSG
jgi:Rieske Fe-S protein